MKQSLIIFAVFFLVLSVYADGWEDFSNVDRMWDGQKTITNQDYEKVVDALEAKKEQKESKKKRKWFKKISGGGTSLHNELKPDMVDIPELKSLDSKEEGVLVNLPVSISLGSQYIEKGYYKLIAQKDEDNKLYIYFYQSQFFKGKVEAIETQDDFGEETLDFAKILPFNNSFVKLIFGSIDYNAYAYLPYIVE